MQKPSRTHVVIDQVARRLRLASVGQRFYLWLFITGALYAALLIANRLLGLAALSLTPASLWAVPVVALVVSLIWHRRPTVAEAARCIDKHGQTKDLFLTYSMLDNAAGEYQSLVVEDAEKRAPQLNPQSVVPFRWARPSAHVAAIGLVLLVSVLYLPQFDPLGRVAQAARVEQDQNQRLEDQRTTQLRIEEVRITQDDDEAASQIDESIEAMTDALRKMRPGQADMNLGQLNQQQRRLGSQWRRLGAEKLSQLLSNMDSLQTFGGERSQKLGAWQKELQNGSDASLRKEMSELGDELQAIAAEKDPVQRNEMMRKLKQRLRDVERFASEKAGSPELASAMRRAMRQLEAAQRDGATAEMMEDMQQTLDLAKMELEQIAESAQELEKLEQSLKVLQMAKQLNDADQLDGEACSECQSLADYADLFEELMGDSAGGGGGLGGQGFGEGGEAPEDDSVASDFETKQSKSALQAGKVLLSMQSQGVSDAGDVEENYQELVGQVKQGVSEAILQEQIPPGYHEAIRGYFDTIGESPGGAE